jgi:hypothetical protein
VQIAVCKYHPKFTERGTSAEVEYEQVDVGGPWTRGQEQAGGGDPTYMEVGTEEENTIELKENDAYASKAV